MFYYFGKVFTVLVENNFYPILDKFYGIPVPQFLSTPVCKVISIEMCSVLQEWFSADLQAKSTVS